MQQLIKSFAVQYDETERLCSFEMAKLTSTNKIDSNGACKAPMHFQTRIESQLWIAVCWFDVSFDKGEIIS